MATKVTPHGAKGIITKRVGPLPVWGWVVIGAGTLGILLVLRKRGTPATVSAAGTGGTLGSILGGASGGGGGATPTPTPTPTPLPTPPSGGPGGGGGTLPGMGGSRPPGAAGAVIGTVGSAVGLAYDALGRIVPSGHVPSSADTMPAEYTAIRGPLDFPGGPGHAGMEQLRVDRQAQGLGILKSLGIDFTPTIVNAAGSSRPGWGPVTGDGYQPFLASLRGTLDFAAKQVGNAASGHAVAISTGDQVANQAVARNLVAEGNTAAVVNGQVIAARSSSDFFNALPSDAQTRLAKWLEATAKR